MSRHQDPRMFLSDLWAEEMINTCHKSFPNWEAPHGAVNLQSIPSATTPSKEVKTSTKPNYAKVMGKIFKAVESAAAQVLDERTLAFSEARLQSQSEKP